MLQHPGQWFDILCRGATPVSGFAIDAVRMEGVDPDGHIP